ncbi:tyrosine-type recombinase/integrase [Shinella sp. BYT-45]|uniref:tyrosine-type recombinase/integrase n=1 Tax=Shinella sp. BYT-45 TaxID=3377377 RepID=UPI00397F027B
MTAGIHRLSDRQVKTHKQRGRLSDGGGVYLQISKWGTKSWEFRFTLHGRTRSMGLGQYDVVSLKKAREEAEALRRIVREGIDPIEARKTAKLKAQVEATTSILFKDAVGKCLARKEGEFRSERHGASWRRSMDAYAVPVIGNMNVAHITVQDILRVLNQPFEDETLWEKRTETASRLRGRIEAVLSWATVAGYRSGDNPARWAGNLKELLPTPSKVAKATKRPALSQPDLPKWFAELRKREGMSARALEFIALCASRSDEVRGATWNEIDLDARMWKIPAERMKMERDHRVPLSDDAIALLKALPRMAGSPYVFPAPRGGPLSDAILSQLMKKMHAKELKAGRKGWLDADTGLPAVPHGLRSTFRVWTAERGYDRDMSEMALAHAVGSNVERAYQRSDMVERRRAMMADWAAYCRGVAPAGNVVQLREVLTKS